jgi:hypothetical protein
MDNRYERKQLRRIERWFERTDPDLARTLSGGVRRRPGVNRGPVRFATGLTGASFVVVGATTTALLLVFAGFLVLMTAWCLHITSSGVERPGRGTHWRGDFPR